MVLVTPKRRCTARKQRLMQLVIENTASGSRFSMREMMLEAGYSESTARSRQAEIGSAVREEPDVKSHLQQLTRLRDKLLIAMESKLDEADYRSLVQGFAVIEKSIARIEPRIPRAKQEHLTPDEAAELDFIIEQNERICH